MRGKSRNFQNVLINFIKKLPIKLSIVEEILIKLLDYSTNFYIIVLTVITILAPSYFGSVFSGIPLNTNVEFFVLLFLISYLLGLVLIKRLNFVLNKKIILFSIPIVMIVSLKIIIFVQTSNHPQGFKACYRSLINDLPDGQCEFSFDSFLISKKNLTRYDDVIDFDSDWVKAGLYDPRKSSASIQYRSWKLGFWDELRFNEYQWFKESHIRERNPFEVTWSGNVLIPHDSDVKLRIEYTGEGKIQLGNNTVLFPTRYLTKSTFLIDINEVLSKDLANQSDKLVLPIKIYYRFQDFSKIGMDKNRLGPNSSISVKLITKKEGISYLRAYYVKDLKFKNTSMLLDAIIILLLLVLTITHLKFLYEENKFLFIVYSIGGVIFLFNTQSQSLINFINSAFKTSVFFFLVVTIANFAKKKKRISYFFISFLFLTQSFIHINADLEKVFYRPPGSDMMTYESFSRSIGKAENITSFLLGQEDIFYHQPFFRYYLAFNHILLGDGNNSVSIFNRFLFLFTIPLIFLFFSQRLKFFPALFFSLAFMNVIYRFVFSHFLYEGYSEYPAWLFTIIAVYLLFCNRSHLGYFIGFVLLGLTCITRFNFLPGILYLIVVFYIYYLFNNFGHKPRQKKYRFIFISFLIFIGIYSLVPLHNYYFGHKLVLTTHNIIRYSLDLPPLKLLHIFSDEKVMQHVLSKLNLMFYLDWKSFYDISFYSFQNFRFFLNLFLCLLSISFLFNLGSFGKIIITHKRGIKMKKETIMNLLFLLIPMPFLFLHLFFDIKSYYPRFIVVGHIMICIFSVYSSGRLINWCYDKSKKILFLLKIKFLYNT